MAEASGRFCRWIERPRPPKYRLADLRDVERLLVEVLFAALSVPRLSGGEGTRRKQPSIRSQIKEWKTLYRKLSGLPLKVYWEVFDPVDKRDKKAIGATLADDLADIYRDLREGLALWDRGFASEAAFQWWFLFETHWGEHITGALRAIRAYRSEHARF